MKHIRSVIEDLRRYIAASAERTELEEIDTMLGIVLEEVRRKLARKDHGDAGRE